MAGNYGVSVRSVRFVTIRYSSLPSVTLDRQDVNQQSNNKVKGPVAAGSYMTAVPGDIRVDDPLQEVQALQKDLKAFSRAVNKPLRDNISYPAFSVDATHSPRRVLLASQNPGDVAILDRLKVVRALPGKAQTAALVRQALALQDGNARIASTPGTPPLPQRRPKGSAQQTPRQDQAALSEAQAPFTAADFQDQLYDAAGAIDLTRVRLKINQHQQDLVAAGLQEPPEQPDVTARDSATQAAPATKLRWQSAAGSSKPLPQNKDFTLRQDSESNCLESGQEQASLSVFTHLAVICLSSALAILPCCHADAYEHTAITQTCFVSPTQPIVFIHLQSA